jgi:ubiquinone/menaquinone biosynthesis C-methylase UbiE
VLFGKYIDGQYRRPTGLMGRWIGGKMAQQHRPENRWTVALLDPQSADQILEIGFGPGIAIQALARRVPRGLVAGIDFSRTMVAVACRRNAAAVKAGRVRLRYATADHLPFAGNSLDKAFGIHTIYFWSQPQAVLRELHRVLKPGGKLVITVLPKEKWGGDDPDAVVGTPECRPYTGAEIARMMIDAGFATTRIVADTELQRPSNFSVIGMKDPIPA